MKGTSDEAPMPGAGKLATSVRLGGTVDSLLAALDDHDLGTGVADCGCVVMDWRFYPCDAHRSVRRRPGDCMGR